MCSACSKGACRGVDIQLCEDFHWAVKRFLCLNMSKYFSVEKLEDRASDYSEREGQITLSLAHLDSDHFLGSDSDDDNCSIQSVA